MGRYGKNGWVREIGEGVREIGEGVSEIGEGVGEVED